MTERTKFEDILFGVLIERDDKSGAFLAYSQNAAPSLFYKRSEALIHKANVAREGRINLRRLKVVKVKATYEIL